MSLNLFYNFSHLKVIYLRGRGIVGLLRNSLVESILEKFKDELEKNCVQEKKQLSQMCEEHGENVNLVWIFLYSFYFQKFARFPFWMYQVHAK